MIGEVFRPTLTVDGLRNLLQDRRTAGLPMPRAIIVSEYERREINQDLLGGSVSPVAKPDQAPEHDGQAIGVIEGVLILSAPEIGKGKARLVL